MKGTCLAAAGHSLQDWNQYQARFRWVEMAKGMSSCCLLGEASLPACVVPVLRPRCDGDGVASWDLAGKSWGRLEFTDSQLLKDAALIREAVSSF